ncbi:MAG: hypothetical protein Q8J68_00305 [Methanolobus sp.]|uniref:hypothetical protein n=1 Tax=Methanolobus sp. TaxID=1874737 RepID=UPI002731E1BF|nr:hypothetical protein [Methanolobus sp.]MDP2215723.1 hypothetical protein [Methanolobus sp.]
MSYTIERYKKDFMWLIDFGESLLKSMFNSYDDTNTDDDAGDNEKLPDFEDDYQSWYSEANLLIKQLLPDRLDDFQRLYKQPSRASHI